MENIVKGMANVPILCALEAGEHQEVLSWCTVRHLDRFDLVYRENTPTDQVYFLLDGMMKIATISGQNREVIKAILYSPDFFGEHGISQLTHREEYAITLSDKATVLEMSLDEFNKLLKKYPATAQALIQFLGQKLLNVEKRLESQTFKNARDRIIDFIREAACKRGKKVGYERLLKRNLTQQEIANYTGTSRQTVTEVFNELRKNNHIYFNRTKILIRDSFNLLCD